MKEEHLLEEEIPLTQEQLAEQAKRAAIEHGKRSLYVICNLADFQKEYDKYVAKGFDNRGEVRYSNDGTKVLIEEAASMFTKEDLTLPGVEVFESNEIRAYLKKNTLEWDRKKK